jgi:hypothetical protein
LPFDKELREIVGLSVADALGLSQFFAKRLQALIDSEFNSKIDAARLVVWSNTERAKKIREAHEAATEGAFRVPAVSLARLRESYPQPTIDRWLSLFSIGRGEGHLSPHYDLGNPVYRKPLVLFRDTGIVSTWVVNELFTAVYDFYETALRGADTHLGNRYFKRRGRILEERCSAAFKTIIGQDEALKDNVFERVGGNEHDHVIIIEGALIVVEDKSADRPDSVTNVDATYLWQTQHMRAKNGIGRGYARRCAF